ncbi:MAG: PilN domain-containing protein [Planctomycetota bacterium]
MSNRLTLILITHSNLTRVDVHGGKSTRAKGVWTRERIPGESTATLVEAALRLGPKNTGDTWVFMNEAWTGVVRLAGDVARVLDGDELDQAIALEAETYSGISAFESRLSFKSLPKDAGGDARWWVTQIPQSDWHEVNQVIRQCRGKLAGMGHPSLGAFPADLIDDADSSSQPWRLNQAFGETTVSVNGIGDAVYEVLTLGDLRTQRTRSQLLEWSGSQTEQEVAVAWVTDRTLPDPLLDAGSTRLMLAEDAMISDVESEDISQVHITGESAIRIWAETVAATLRIRGKGDAQMPFVVAEKPPMSNRSATVIACALGVLFAVGAFAIHFSTNRQLAELDSQIDQFNRTKNALAEDKKTLLDNEKELADKQKTLDEMRALNIEVSANLAQATLIRKFQKARWLNLVSAISKASESGCWVRGLESRGNVVTVQGVAVSNRDISVFATKLEEYASPHGWRVHPAQTERNEMALVDFEVSLDVADYSAPKPQVNSSMVRAIAPVSLVVAPTQTARSDNKR